MSYNNCYALFSHLSQLSPSASRRGERNYSQVIDTYCTLMVTMATCKMKINDICDFVS